MSTYTLRPTASQQRQQQAQKVDRSRGRTDRSASTFAASNERSASDADTLTQVKFDEQRRVAIERMQRETDVKAVEKAVARRLKEERDLNEKIRQYERINPSYKPHFLRSPDSPADKSVAQTAEEIRQARLAKLDANGWQRAADARAADEVQREATRRRREAESAQNELDSGLYGYRLGST